MTDLATGLTTAHRFTFAALNGHIYGTNGWDPVKRWDGVETATKDAGIAMTITDWTGTVTTAAGTTTVGSHKLRYRYKSKATGYISNPSNEVTKTVASGAQKLTFTIDNTGGGNIKRSADAKVDLLVLEATTEGGATFFEAAEVANSATSVDLNMADAVLEAGLLEYTDTGHGVPPYASIMVAHKGRLIMSGQVVHSSGTVAVTNGSAVVTGTTTSWTAATVDRFIQVGTDTTYYRIKTFTSATSITLDVNYTGSTDSGLAYKIFSTEQNILYESKPLYPESFPALSFTKCLVNKNDRVRALYPYLGDLLVCGDRVTERWSYNEVLVDDGQPFPVPGDRGALNQRCIVDVDGAIYGWDRAGIWRFSGGVQEHISYPVDPLFQVMNWSVSDTFHVVAIPIERTIRFYWARDDDAVTHTLPRDFLEYNIEKRVWGTGRHTMAITASATVGTGNERRAILGDENGHLWFVVGTTEGAHPTSTVVGTIASSPAPTATEFTLSGATLYTTGDALKGVPCYSVGKNEEQIITSNTATRITLATGYTGAPAAGTKAYIGRINSILRTKAYSLSKLSEKFTERFLHLFFEPSSTAGAELRVRMYENYSATAATWSMTVTDLTSGVDVTNGTSDFIVDLTNSDGYARIPVGMDWKRVVEFEFELRYPKADFVLLGYELDGAVDMLAPL